MPPAQPLQLTEYSRAILSPAAINEAQAALIQRRYGRQLTLTLLFGDGGRWQLTAGGWVGILNAAGLQIEIRPRTSINNLLQLLRVAYGVVLPHDRQLLAQETIGALFDALALTLAQAVLRRARQGIYRAYLPRRARLPYVRGRLLIEQQLLPSPTPLVAYEAFSADLPHNQLLRYALHLVVRSGLVDSPLPARAYRALPPQVSLVPFNTRTMQLSYSRLNQDYEPLHALCRLLIDGLAPAGRFGEQQAPPFLIEMATLFEKGVANWLQRHLPPPYHLRVQERSVVGGGKIQTIADLVVVDGRSGRVFAVLDTKYKTDVDNQDIYQITFYANARSSPQALLVYPTPLPQPLDARVGDLRLRTATFDLSLPIDSAGQAFLTQLFAA